MRVGIVGAGLAGLAAARTLAKAGHEVVLFEKESAPGGRVSTLTIGDYIFDPGATTMAPRGKTLEQVMLNELPTDELVRVDKPIYIHESLRPRAGDPDRGGGNRYTYRTGNGTLPKLLAAGLDIHLGVEIEEVGKLSEGGFLLDNDFFEAVIVTVPAPQALALLQRTGESRPLANVYFRPCLSILLGYANALPEVKYHALLDPDQRHPMTWLSLESVKSPGRAAEGHAAMVVQMSPAFSSTYMASPDERVVDLASDYIERLYGKDWAAPQVSAVVRYQYSQPEACTSFDAVNRPAARLLVAGDSLMGSRTEHAYESGVRAAQLLMAG